MQITVKCLAGREFTLQTSTDDIIADLKSKIEELEGFPRERQRLIFSGAPLEDSRTLSDYCIKEDSTVHLLYLTAEKSPVLRLATWPQGSQPDVAAGISTWPLAADLVEDRQFLSEGTCSLEIESGKQQDQSSAEDLPQATTPTNWISLRSSGQRNSAEGSSLALGGVNLAGVLAVGLICIL